MVGIHEFDLYVSLEPDEESIYIWKILIHTMDVKFNFLMKLGIFDLQIALLS